MLRYIFLLIVLATTGCLQNKPKSDLSIHENKNEFGVLTFNMWVGGEAGKQSLDKSVEVIRASGAKLVGLQEIYGDNPYGPVRNNAEKIAEMLGWNFLDQGGYGILSEFPFLDTAAAKMGVKIKINDDRLVWFFNCHLNYIPYQPYQLARIKYGNFPFISSEKEAVIYADSARGKEVREYLKEIHEKLPEGLPVILTGDFNEPSFQDWTQKAAESNLCQLKVEWPATKAFADIGMTDAFRAFYTDEVQNPGETWSSIDSPGEIHDRIDFIFFKGNELKVTGANTIGLPDGKSGIEIQDYPSDHRAVCVSFLWEK